MRKLFLVFLLFFPIQAFAESEFQEKIYEHYQETVYEQYYQPVDLQQAGFFSSVGKFFKKIGSAVVNYLDKKAQKQEQANNANLSNHDNFLLQQQALQMAAQAEANQQYQLAERMRLHAQQIAYRAQLASRIAQSKQRISELKRARDTLPASAGNTFSVVHQNLSNSINSEIASLESRVQAMEQTQANLGFQNQNLDALYGSQQPSSNFVGPCPSHWTKAQCFYGTPPPEDSGLVPGSANLPRMPSSEGQTPRTAL